MMAFLGALNLNNSNEISSAKLHGEHSVSYLVQEFMLKNDTLKNSTSRIGLYVRTANASRTAL